MTKVFGIGFLLGTFAGILLCRQYFPYVKTETKYETAQKVVEKARIKTVIVEKPGGEKTITKVEYVDKVIDNTSSGTIVQYLPDWRASLAGYSDRSWSVGLHRRVFGGLSVGVVGRSDKTAGIEIGLEF